VVASADRGLVRDCIEQVVPSGVTRLPCELHASEARAGVDVFVTVTLTSGGHATAT